MYFIPLIDTERIAFRHREGDINSYEKESDNDLPCVGTVFLGDLWALPPRKGKKKTGPQNPPTNTLYPDKAREARRPPSPPSNGAPDRR